MQNPGGCFRNNETVPGKCIIPQNGRLGTEGKNQTLVGAIPFCGEYPGPRFDNKFRSANQIDGISIADGGKMADS